MLFRDLRPNAHLGRIKHWTATTQQQATKKSLTKDHHISLVAKIQDVAQHSPSSVVGMLCPSLHPHTRHLLVLKCPLQRPAPDAEDAKIHYSESLQQSLDSHTLPANNRCSSPAQPASIDGRNSHHGHLNK